MTYRRGLPGVVDEALPAGIALEERDIIDPAVGDEVEIAGVLDAGRSGHGMMLANSRKGVNNYRFTSDPCGPDAEGREQK